MIMLECKVCGEFLGPLKGTAPSYYREHDPDKEGWVKTEDGWICWDCNDSDDKSRQLELI